jgi:hypothetical protein
VMTCLVRVSAHHASSCVLPRGIVPVGTRCSQNTSAMHLCAAADNEGESEGISTCCLLASGPHHDIRLNYPVKCCGTS